MIWGRQSELITHRLSDEFLLNPWRYGRIEIEFEVLGDSDKQSDAEPCGAAANSCDRKVADARIELLPEDTS